MTDSPRTTQEVAEQIRSAMSAADLTQFADLLDPDVHWGGPDDPAPACQNRKQVLEWYRRARDRGVQGTVTDLAVAGDKILVGMEVTGSPATEESGGTTQRWQVLNVRDGKVTEIVGYDSREVAAAQAGVAV
jgi:ketosteroid isomerase-like protein